MQRLEDVTHPPSVAPMRTLSKRRTAVWLPLLHAGRLAFKDWAMSVKEHDPSEFVREIAGQLATRSRHVCVLLGAGASRACGLPDLRGLEKAVAAKLGSELGKVYASLLEGRNLEQVLTRLRRLAEVLHDGQVLDGLTAADAAHLDKEICQAVTEILRLDPAEASPMVALASWAVRAQYHEAVEIFTLNYDLLLEGALDSVRARYFDGFVGTVRARFHTDMVEGLGGGHPPILPPSFVRVWKLHGSVSWERSEDPPDVVRLGGPVPSGLAAAIYPSDAKYEESRRVPFVVLMDRFRRALLQPETLLLVAGYSFQDQHINELLFDAALRRERSSFIVFCFGDIPEELAKRALTTPSLVVAGEREAIWNGVRGQWSAVEDQPGIFEAGTLRLVDFANLAALLARGQASEASHV